MVENILGTACGGESGDGRLHILALDKQAKVKTLLATKLAMAKRQARRDYDIQGLGSK